MAHVRRNVWELDEWSDPVLWYARGVAVMKARVLAEPTSWGFFAAIHGFHAEAWADAGSLGPNDEEPSSSIVEEYWNQCQHGSWYFLPWHRGYLLAFEAVVRAAVVERGGPDDWALPYWNYFRPGQAALPPAFASPTWPDGGINPLFVEQRYGLIGDGTVTVRLTDIDLQALADPDFTGPTEGGGFGGPDTGFSHAGRARAGIELDPHNAVHGMIGGRDPASGRSGLMSSPVTAGLDPVFWLHHANIDRLWAVWRQDPRHLDPSDRAWLGGPRGGPRERFVMPAPGGPPYVFTPGTVTDLEGLGYQYDDLAPAGVLPPGDERFAAVGGDRPQEGAHPVVPGPQRVELVGSNDETIAWSGSDEVRSVVALDPRMRDRAATSFAAGPGVPDRFFVNLENVRARTDAIAFDVFVGAGPAGPGGGEQRVGGVGLFGVSEASDPAGGAGGDGLTLVLEITEVVRSLGLDDTVDLTDLSVRLTPVQPIREDDELSIGRISVYRQGR